MNVTCVDAHEKVKQMRKIIDLSRLAVFEITSAIAVSAGSNKLIRGVTDGPLKVIVTMPDQSDLLYDVLPVGRFQIEIRPPKNAIVAFEPVEPKTKVCIEREPQKTIRNGDPEESFTDLSPRPAINPELQAVLRQMNIMAGEMRTLKDARRPAPVVKPSAQSVEPEPDPFIEEPAVDPAPAPEGAG